MVRGSYQAGMALRMARKDLQGLTQAQKELIRQSQDALRAANNWIFAGAAFMAFGFMAWRGISRMMEASGRGRRVMWMFGKRMERVMSRLSEAMAPFAEKILGAVASVLEFIVAVPVLRELAGGFMIALAAGLVLSGMIMLLKGGISALIAVKSMLALKTTLLTGAFQQQQAVQTSLIITQEGYIGRTVAATGATQGLTAATIGLGTAISIAVGAFMLAYVIVDTIGRLFGRLPAVIAGVTIMILGLAVAVAALRGAFGDISGLVMFGASLAAGGALMAAYAGTLASYQYGTSFVRRGGLAQLHGGEEIISARETRYTAMIEKQREVRETRIVGRRVINVPVTIHEVNTRAEFDDWLPKISRELAKQLDRKT
jgi:hypothetical protein